MENKWLNKENIGYRDVIVTDIGVVNTTDLQVFDMTQEQLEKFREIMKDVDDLTTRCITVYRDSVIIDSNIYNICLSCGDILINGKKHGLGAGKEKLQKLKEEIIK